MPIFPMPPDAPADAPAPALAPLAALTAVHAIADALRGQCGTDHGYIADAFTPDADAAARADALEYILTDPCTALAECPDHDYACREDDPPYPDSDYPYGEDDDVDCPWADRRQALPAALALPPATLAAVYAAESAARYADIDGIDDVDWGSIREGVALVLEPHHADAFTAGIRERATEAIAQQQAAIVRYRLHQGFGVA